MESESGQSDITSTDPTKRIIKYFSKCLIELIKHAESIQYKNNKLVNYDVSSTVDYDSCHEIDITEHNIKTEYKKEGPIFKQIETIKQSIVELLTICSQENISIDYDTTKPHVAIYDGFDDPQRILVMNHLTLHIISIVENIYLSVKYFKSKQIDIGQEIKRNFSNIYKEIKSLPMRPDIIDNMDSSFESLTHKSEYKDSYNYLVEKLSILSKRICKFNKSYLKKCGYNDFVTTEDSTDDDNSPRKKIKSKILEKTYIQPESNCTNGHKEQESVFKIPESMENNNPNVGNISTPKHSNETRKNKKHKMNTDTEKKNNDNSENVTERDLLLNKLLNDTINEHNINSDSEKRNKKKKKNKINPEQKTPDNSCDTSEKESNKLTSTTADNTNKNQNVNTESNNTENGLNVCKNDKAGNEKKKRKNKKENLNNSIEKSPTKKDEGNTGKENLEVPKKRKIDKEEFEKEQLIKKRKLENRLNNTATNTTINKIEEEKNKNAKELNQEEKCDEINDDDLSALANIFYSNDESYDSNTNAENDDNFRDMDTMPTDILAAISSGNVEADYDLQEFDNFVKVIKENNLNEHEKFLYIQCLLDSANAKVAISEEKKEAIKNLKILVDWEVCPTHLVGTNLSQGPSNEEKEILQKLGVTTGQYSIKEDETIRKNWKEFCQKHDLDDDPAPFLHSIVDNERLLSFAERKKFLQHIGRGLPQKSLFSIFRRFRVLFKPKVKHGRFSPEEDDLILTYCSKMKRADHRQKYVRLAPLINRDRLQIERRYRVLKRATGEPSKKIQWNLALQETFLKHLLEETQSENLEDLRNKHIDFETFMIIGKLMNIPAAKLRVHWIFRFYTELFATEPINTDLIKIKLLKKFKELGYDDWKTIDWKPIVAMFDGLNKSYLWLTLKNLTHDHVPSEKQKNLKDSIDHLHKKHLPKLQKRIKEGKDLFAPRLRFENGTLIKYK